MVCGGGLERLPQSRMRGAQLSKSELGLRRLERIFGDLYPSRAVTKGSESTSRRTPHLPSSHRPTQFGWIRLEMKFCVQVHFSEHVLGRIG